MSLGSSIREGVRAVEEWWFDTTRGVKTAGMMRKLTAAEVVGEIRDGYIYAPVRTANAHAALRDTPVQDFSDYTFIDIGSGKGRMLFVAAEYPFRKVIGVEFGTALHQQALDNIAQYKFRGQRCGEIVSLNTDAADFEFPAGKLVLYLFNPFGPEILSRMLANLERSLKEDPRHVVVVLLWPENWKLWAEMNGMKQWRKTRRHHIYQIGAE